MVSKKKLCAGCNDLTYIYKNIEGKKYCKTCTQKLQPPKPIKKRSEKQVFKINLKKLLVKDDIAFYTKVWDNKFYGGDYMVNPYCEIPSCRKKLGSEPNMMFFHHILEKRNFPHLRHDPNNIAIICAECHNKYETLPDSVPYLVKKREILLKQEEFRKHFLGSKEE